MPYLFCILLSSFSARVFSAPDPKNLRVIYTNDWQSNLDYAPMALAKIQELQTQSPYPTITVDAGDTLMGSLYHTIAHKTGGGFTLMGKLNFDATTLGNHELDFGIHKLSQILKATHHTHPQILASNLSLNTLLLQNDPQFKSFKKSLIIEKNGLKIGLIGLMGNHAQKHIKTSSEFHFQDPYSTAQQLVSKLKREGAKYIIALSHGGIHLQESGLWEGDDIELSKTQHLDLIIGGHSHTALQLPLKQKNNWVVQAGSHLQFVGHIDIHTPDNTVISAKLHPISLTPSGDFAHSLAHDIAEWRSLANKDLEKDLHLSWKEPLPTKQSISSQETQLLVAEAIREYAQSDFSMVGAGEIYPQSTTTPWTVDTVFKILPLGQGVRDDTPGAAILKAWFYGYEIINLLESMLFLSKFTDSDFEPIFSGAHIAINTYRPPFFKIYDFNLTIDQTPLDPYKLYSVATTSFGGSYLWQIQDLSYGLLNITPRTSQGKKSKNFKLHTLNSSHSSEAKAWASIALWLKKHTIPQEQSFTIIKTPYAFDAFCFYTTALFIFALTTCFLREVIKKLPFFLKLVVFLPISRLSLKTK
ncbi:MAG: bifunctional UDP-sugar hydrolase/5'-nucleotidase [Oligoflexales bacterium]